MKPRAWTLLLPTIAVCIVTNVTALFLHPHPSDWTMFVDYAVPMTKLLVLTVLIWFFARFLVLARNFADSPIPTVFTELRQRAPLLAMPAIICPLFLTGFTLAKFEIGRVNGFSWDPAFADLDALIFGQDPWVLAHKIGDVSSWIEFCYSKVWPAVLIFALCGVVLFCDQAFAARFILAMALSWLLGGVVLAHALSSAGPIYYHHFHPGDRFAALRDQLALVFDPTSPNRDAQAYLLQRYLAGVALKGSGISAMPSMHVAQVALFVVAARGNLLFWPALGFAAIILFGSVYLGWHYAVDGLLSIPLVVICWQLAGAWLRVSRPSQEAAAEPVPIG